MVIDVQKTLTDLPGDAELALIEIGERLQVILEKVPRDDTQREEYLYDAMAIVRKWCAANKLVTPKVPHTEMELNWGQHSNIF